MDYLAIPIDVIPDFMPVLGYADDAVIVTLALGGTVRRAGLDAVHAHWSGPDDGFAALCRLAGLPIPGSTIERSGQAGLGQRTGGRNRQGTPWTKPPAESRSGSRGRS